MAEKTAPSPAPPATGPVFCLDREPAAGGGGGGGAPVGALGVGLLAAAGLSAADSGPAMVSDGVEVPQFHRKGWPMNEDPGIG